MANLDQKFHLVGVIESGQETGIRKVLETLPGVNHVKVQSGGSEITVGYTPGLIGVQNIKEAIESQGLDVSDRGDD